MVSSILGKEYASLTVLPFNLWKSIQNLGEPSLLWIRTTLVKKGLRDSLIAQHLTFPLDAHEPPQIIQGVLICRVL